MFALQKRKSLINNPCTHFKQLENNKIYPKQAESDNKDKTRNQLNWKHKTIEENNKSNCCFIEKINKIYNNHKMERKNFY